MNLLAMFAGHAAHLILCGLYAVPFLALSDRPRKAMP